MRKGFRDWDVEHVRLLLPSVQELAGALFMQVLMLYGSYRACVRASAPTPTVGYCHGL